MLGSRLRVLGRTLLAGSRNHLIVGKLPVKPTIALRAFSTPTGGATEKASTEGATQAKTEDQANSQRTDIVNMDYDEYDDYEPKTAKEKVAWYSRIAFRLGLLGLGAVCLFLTGRELFPGRMSPNSLFSEVFDKLRFDYKIQDMVGENMKAFGRDVGRNTEGRRNHVDSYKYYEEADKSNRLRVRFNIKGDKGQVLVYVEVSDKMKDDEYVYIICQNVRTGRVLTIVDNRDQLEAGLLGNSSDSSDISKFFFGGGDSK
eukprot:gene29789-35968_t